MLKLTLALVVAAGPFHDDFEGPGVLVSDAGRWDQLFPSARATFLLSPQAAHRGDAGIHWSDVDPAPGTGTGTFLYKLVSPDAGYRNAFVRAWVRLQGNADAGNAVLLQWGHFRKWAISAQWPTRRLAVGGLDRDSTYVGSVSGLFLDGNWQLVEILMTDFDVPDAGRLRVFLDGVEGNGLDRLDLGLSSGFQLELGEIYTGDSRFVGEWDCDDVTISESPTPQRLSLSAPASAAIGACTEVGVGLQDALGRAASATYELVATLTGPLTVFSDPACTTQVTEARLVAGSSETQIWIHWPAAPVSFRAEHLDVFAAMTIVGTNGTDAGSADAGDVDAGSADAGEADAGHVEAIDAGPGSGTYAVGCGCGGGDPASLGVVAMLLAICLRARKASAAGE